MDFSHQDYIPPGPSEVDIDELQCVAAPKQHIVLGYDIRCMWMQRQGQTL